MKSKGNKSIDLGQLQATAEGTTRSLKAANTKLEAARKAQEAAQREHDVAVRALQEGVRAVGAITRVSP